MRHLLLVCVFLLSSSLTLFADGSRSYSCVSQQFSLTLPAAYRVSLGSFHADDYSSADFFQKDLQLPKLKHDSKDSNALGILCPGGAYAIVFGFNSSFLNVDEMASRIYENARTFAANNASRPDDLIHTETTSSMLGALAANEICIRRTFADSDSVFTEIIVATAGTRTYGLIMRSRENMMPKSTTTMRQILVTILSALSIESAYDSMKFYDAQKQHFAISVPQFWSAPLYKIVPNPMPEVPLISGTRDTLKQTRAVTSDSAWNTIIFQLPLFQLEIVSHQVASLDSSERHVAHAASFVKIQPSGRLDPIVNENIPFAGISGTDMSFSIFRRGSVVRYQYLIAQKGTTQIVARITAWQHDLPIFEASLKRVLGSLRVQ